MADRYKPDRKGLMLKYGSIAATGVIAGGSLISISACSRKDQWAKTSGQAGQINLEAVDKAMQESKNVSEFEESVNKIYQGEEMVLIEVKNEGNEQLVSGYADLNENSKIDEDGDEKLFTFRRWFDGENRAEMQGHGVNSYYHHTYPPGTGFLTTYLLLSALSSNRSPTYHYTTVPQRVTVIKNQRAGYRSTPSYRTQVDANRQFQTKMSAQHGTAYRNAKPTTARQQWAANKGINLSKSTSAARSASRSSSRWGGSRTGSRSFGGGFKGGGTGGGVGLLSKVEHAASL